MARATTAANRAPTGQPMPMESPPPALRADGKAVIPPARTQIMEKEMAKLENAPIRRESSCL